jgi:FixJ family two-component response regulator
MVPGEGESPVYVIDDDAGVRQSLTSLLQSIGMRVEAFGSAADFLKKGRIVDGIAAACLILDVRLPGTSGLDFQAELARPIFICQSFSSVGTAMSRLQYVP